jgi:hypothetical protein
MMPDDDRVATNDVLARAVWGLPCISWQLRCRHTPRVNDHARHVAETHAPTVREAISSPAIHSSKEAIHGHRLFCRKPKQ